MTIPSWCGRGVGLSPDQEVGTGDRLWPFRSGFPQCHQDTPLGEELKPPTPGVQGAKLESPLPSPPQEQETFGLGLTQLSRDQERDTPPGNPASTRTRTDVGAGICCPEPWVEAGAACWSRAATLSAAVAVAWRGLEGCLG